MWLNSNFVLQIRWQQFCAEIRMFRGIYTVVARITFASRQKFWLRRRILKIEFPLTPLTITMLTPLTLMTLTPLTHTPLPLMTPTPLTLMTLTLMPLTPPTTLLPNLFLRLSFTSTIQSYPTCFCALLRKTQIQLLTCANKQF